MQMNSRDLKKMTAFPCRFIFYSFFAILCSCGNDQTPDPPKLKKEDLINANKALRQKESDEIDAKVKNMGWDMQMTGTGLRYMFVERGTGDSAKLGLRATINYQVKLLQTGEICYSSDSIGPEEFLIGRDYVETGLHEGIQLMRTGDKVMFILPSHLAHGLLGDWEKIPPLSPVIYYIHLTELKK